MYCGRTSEKHCKCLAPKDAIPAEKVNLKEAVRKLFTDHAVYTAFVMKSIVAGSGDLQVFVTRLLRNQKDIGDNLKPIIGEENGNRLTELLTEHIKLAAKVISNASKKDQNLQSSIDALFANSDEVAQFLTSLNPAKLPYAATQNMFHAHNQYVIDMTVSRLAGRYEDEQRLYDSYYNEILEMADDIYAAL
jgi:hypothetical protein